MKTFINYIIDSIRAYWAPSKKCAECGKTFYPCKTCTCAYDDAGAAVRCSDWDDILKHQCHGHHHHEEDVSYSISDEMKWLNEHREEQRIYAGRCVAVKADQGIVASGYNFNEVRAQLKEKGISISHTLFARIDDDYESE